MLIAVDDIISEGVDAQDPTAQTVLVVCFSAYVLKMRKKAIKNIYVLWKVQSCSYKFTISRQFLDSGIVSDPHAWFRGFYLTAGCVQGTKKGGALRRICWRQRCDGTRSYKNCDHVPIVHIRSHLRV